MIRPQDQNSIERRSSFTRLTCITVIVTGLLLAAGCGEKQTVPSPRPPEVTVATPETRNVTPVFTFTGTTEAIRSVNIVARVQGYLETMTFTAADFVEKNELLFVIEQEPFEARRDLAKANLESAEAALRRAESDLDRLEQAVKTDAVSQQEVTRALAERDQAAAALLGARASLTVAEIQLDYTTIESPISGMVSRNLVDPGNLVGLGGETLLATVRMIDPIFAYFEMNERLFSRILEERGGHTEPGENPEGDVAATLVIRETGHRSVGKIDSIDNTVDTATGTIMVRGVFPNPDAKIFPGFFVNVEIEGTQVEDAIVVRESAIGTDLGGKYLYVVGDDNVVEQRYVQPGFAQNDGTIVIDEGLEGNERYVVEGLLRARPGLPVTPQTAAEAGGD